MDQNITQVSRAAIASLEEVMLYENIDVIERFMESWEVSLESSTEIFNELKMWLWLCADNATNPASKKKVPNLAITSSMTLLDEMWHAFILFTKQYTSFCKTHFGFYIHHGPTTSSQKEEAEAQIKNGADEYLKNLEKELTFQYEYIYELLGEKTLKKWYSDWTDLYTPEHLNQLYKKQW